MYAEVATSVRRNIAFLSPAEQATFAPSPSEAASRTIHARMAPVGRRNVNPSRNLSRESLHCADVFLEVSA